MRIIWPNVLVVLLAVLVSAAAPKPPPPKPAKRVVTATVVERPDVPEDPSFCPFSVRFSGDAAPSAWVSGEGEWHFRAGMSREERLVAEHWLDAWEAAVREKRAEEIVPVEGGK